MSKNGLAPGERGISQDAARIIGVSARTVQDMAQNGELPGAVKVRRRWTFDLQKLRDKMREDKRRRHCHEHHAGDQCWLMRRLTVSGGVSGLGSGVSQMCLTPWLTTLFSLGQCHRLTILVDWSGPDRTMTDCTTKRTPK